MLLALRMLLNVFHGRLWALQRGASVISFDLPDAPPRRGATLVERVVGLAARAVRRLALSPEQRAVRFSLLTLARVC